MSPGSVSTRPEPHAHRFPVLAPVEPGRPLGTRDCGTPRRRDRPLAQGGPGAAPARVHRGHGRRARAGVDGDDVKAGSVRSWNGCRAGSPSSLRTRAAACWRRAAERTGRGDRSPVPRAAGPRRGRMRVSADQVRARPVPPPAQGGASPAVRRMPGRAARNRRIVTQSPAGPPGRGSGAGGAASPCESPVGVPRRYCWVDAHDGSPLGTRDGIRGPRTDYPGRPRLRPDPAASVASIRRPPFNRRRPLSVARCAMGA